MRLTEEERAAIRRVVDRATAGRARVWLFGSRTDDSARGGDLDLMVESLEAVDHPARLIAEIGAELESALGERRIDVLLQAPNLKPTAVHRAAKSSGILL
jgi:predicted nucleotidyltransferase